ncbi:predicted protein [Sclerotinia sclerotiorum 1980 UF-70]|uniref:Uncharacterized protein n=1 Tax=Sclerotinia sclerotiorum (strain ATCC 18683 / 1980 / Ss-1) TaxID=665079 RepID=A7E9Y8_SCLS1|nr:predicted protein [Sclerotinia sclerotiorum 1980 UF-70]EDN99266.1 predicted protein [Sclerotinia sclerotiorum 1980 UF-70]
MSRAQPQWRDIDPMTIFYLPAVKKQGECIIELSNFTFLSFIPNRNKKAFRYRG